MRGPSNQRGPRRLVIIHTSDQTGTFDFRGRANEYLPTSDMFARSKRGNCGLVRACNRICHSLYV